MDTETNQLSLVVEEEDGFVFHVEHEQNVDLGLCLVGRILTSKANPFLDYEGEDGKVVDAGEGSYYIRSGNVFVLVSVQPYCGFQYDS